MYKAYKGYDKKIFTKLNEVGIVKLHVTLTNSMSKHVCFSNYYDLVQQVNSIPMPKNMLVLSL